MKWLGRLVEIRVILIIRMRGKVSYFYYSIKHKHERFPSFPYFPSLGFVFLPRKKKERKKETSMINILLHSTIFSPLNKNTFSIFFYSSRGLFLAFPSLPPIQASFKSNIMRVFQSANELLCLLFLEKESLDDVNHEKEKLLWMAAVKDTDGAMDSFKNILLSLSYSGSHNIFIGAFIVFCSIHQRKGASEGLEKAKRDTLNMSASNNFFDDGIKWKNGSDPKQKKEWERERESEWTRLWVQHKIYFETCFTWRH